MENKNTSPKDKIKEVLEKIRNNELKPHSKSYFTLKLLLLILVTALILITSVFLFSFILFSLRATGQSSLIGFGPHGSRLFLILFPWKLLIADIILLGIFGWLIRSFRFGYKSPLLYLLLSVLAVMVIGGFIIDKETPFHDSLLHKADKHHLPFFEDMYEGVRHQPPPPRGHGVYRGVIDSISTTTPESLIISIDDPETGTTTAYTFPLSEISEPDLFRPGDRVFISGEIKNNQLSIFRIQKWLQPPQRD